MRIVFSTDHIYLHGGIEKVLAEKANYFAENLNYEVIIITSQQDNKPSCYSLSDKVKLLDLGIDYDRTKSYFHVYNLKKVFKHYSKRRKLLIRIDPDIVVVVNYDFDFFWMPFIHKKSKKIKEFHSSQYLRPDASSSIKNKLFSKINTFIESKYNALVLLNKDEKKFFKSANTVVIPNPIKIPEYQSKLEKKQVLAAGRIAPVKGFDRLIDAWSLVVANHKDWELHIYGEDYLGTQSKLEKQIAALGIEKNVIFKGVTENMTKTMLDYSLYLMSSYTESFSMVIVESFSVGVPVVAFDVPTGPRNLITNHIDGVLVKNNEIDSYSESIVDLISDTSKRKAMGVNAKNNSLYFSNRNIMTKWSQLFESFMD